MRNCLFFFISMLVANVVQATSWGTSCEYTTQNVSISLPSGIKISIDPNAPIGTIFYDHYVNAQVGSLFKCTSPTSFTSQQGYLYDNGGTTTTLTGYGLNGSYPVYKTNVAGLGIVVRYSATAFPFWISSIATYTNTTISTTFTSRPFDIELIKYGEISTGAKEITIDSSTIPDILNVLKIDDSSDAGKNPNGMFVLKRFKFSPATINILTATCDTSDVTVNLGSRKISDTTNREGGKLATPWTDASIRLTNCPEFYGTGERSNKKGTIRNNVMTVTLLPSKATTSSQGIMPIDTDSSAAAGVGIQLAYGTAASPQLVDFSTGKAEQNYTMSSTQGTTYTIPLVARYYQTAGALSDIMPGKANGKITYLINYY